MWHIGKRLGLGYPSSVRGRLDLIAGDEAHNLSEYIRRALGVPIGSGSCTPCVAS